MATLGDIFGNTQEDLAEPPGSGSRVLSSSEASATGRSLEDDLRTLQEVRTAQAQSIQQHVDYRAGLEQAQDRVNLRAQDLEIANRALKVFDTGTYDPATREFMFKGLVRQLGVDYRSENAKDLWKMIRGLSPDSALAVRQNIAGQISGATPGQVVQAFSGVLRGEVDPLELFSATRTQPQGREAFYAEHGPPMMAGASGAVVPQAQSQTVDADEVAASVVSQAGDAKTAPDLRQVHPQIAKMYGLDPNTPHRNADVVSRGYDGPMNMKDQEKWIKERATVVEDGAKALDSFVMMEYISRGRPEVLRLSPFSIPGIGRVELPTIAEVATGALNVVEGIQEPVAPKTESRLKGFADSAVPAADAMPAKDRFMGKRVSRRLTEDVEGTMLEQLPRSPDRGTVRENAQLTSALDSYSAELVFRMGRMAGQSGHAFSDKDRDIFVQQYAGSSDPGARRAAMQVSAGKMFADMDPALVNALANRVIARNNPEITQAYLASPVVPQNVKDAIRARAEAPTQSGQQQPTQQQQPPAQQRSESTPVPGIVVTDPQQAAASPSQQQQAPSQPKTIAEERADLQRAQQQAQQMLLEKHDIAIKRFKMDEQIAKENRDYRARQEARQARKDAEEQREKIQAAFARAGALIAGSRGGGGLGGGTSMGPDQDASAFKIAPGAGAKRAPPSPAPPQSGFENVRRLRRAQGS